ncbi:MAG: response regulator [Gammaproteobacteria bacterium]|nr:response regulator [Gammaproteobacteria bacterium]
MEAKTILVVDDAPANIDLSSQMLKEQYRVKAATNGDKALASAAKAPPDLVLLDVMMPGMDGYEVCRQLKSNPQTARIPVVFLSAKISREDQQRGMDMGAIGYLTKPVEEARLRETLEIVFSL